MVVRLLMRMIRGAALLTSLAIVVGVPASVTAADGTTQPLKVAVAANFRHTFEALRPELEQQELAIIPIYASSGTLMQQILHGAPFQVFLSADSQRPKALEAAGRIQSGSRRTYAIGQLALWSRMPDIAPQALLQQQDVRLAIANPELAPYGQAAVETLTALKLWQAPGLQKVWGRDIAQTFIFARTGHADLAFVAAAQLHHDQKLGGGSSWIVPSHYYQPIEQQLAIIAPNKNDAAAGAGGGAAALLVKRLLAPKIQAIIRSYGYQAAYD